MRPGGPAPSARWAPDDLAHRPSPPAVVATAAAPAVPSPSPEALALAEAYQHGFDEGRLEGEAAEQARLRTVVAAAEEALELLREGEARWMGTIEENVCALAVAIARHVIGREVATDPEVVAGLVRRALDEFPVDQPLRIRVHPQDLAQLQRAGADGHSPGDFTAGREARWIPDPVVAPGGCIVEGRERIVDGRVDTALERLYRRLTYTDA